MLTDLARGFAIALLAVLVARTVSPLLTGRWRLAVIAGCGAWLLMPALVQAYGWSMTAWASAPSWRDATHAALAGFRLAPLALLAAWLAPQPPLAAEALHARRLVTGAGPAWWTAWWLRGPGRRWLLALALVVPPATAEFELASRLAVDAWAVRLFDAQAGGRALADCLRAAAPVALVQALVALAVVVGTGSAATTPATATAPRGSGGARCWPAWIVLAAGTGLLVLWPAWQLGVGAWRASGSWPAPTELLREAVASLSFGATGAVVAWLLAGWRRGRPLVWLLAALGLCGALPVGLLLLAGLAPIAAAAPPLPLALALACIALPLALLLRRGGSVPAPARHAARLVAVEAPQRRLAARLAWRAGGWIAPTALVALAWWCAWDLPAQALLHPVDMTPLTPLLYHVMHYGAGPALTARLVVAVAAPLLTALAAWWLWRAWWVRQAARP